jgi:hypothetical protein
MALDGFINSMRNPLPGSDAPTTRGANRNGNRYISTKRVTMNAKRRRIRRIYPGLDQ